MIPFPKHPVPEIAEADSAEVPPYFQQLIFAARAYPALYGLMDLLSRAHSFAEEFERRVCDLEGPDAVEVQTEIKAVTAKIQQLCERTHTDVYELGCRLGRAETVEMGIRSAKEGVACSRLWGRPAK